MILSLLVFLLAYFLAGTPPVGLGDAWFVFGVACAVMTLAAAITQMGPLVVVQNPILQAPAPDPEESE